MFPDLPSVNLHRDSDYFRADALAATLFRFSRFDTRNEIVRLRHERGVIQKSVEEFVG